VARIRILGIDPGLNRTGFGVIEVDGSRLVFVDAGVIRVPAGSLPQRMRTILEGLRGVIATTLPQRAAIEKVFVNINPQSTLLLGQARGAAICAAIAADLDVNEHTALQVKQAVVGYGRADKKQVQVMVQRLLCLEAVPAPDAADALACAICDAHGSRLAALARGGDEDVELFADLGLADVLRQPLRPQGALDHFLVR
jgi:crossover junction endodeoxyribonuclease RuvC